MKITFHTVHGVLKARILKLKKVGKTARPFRYDLNQIPYDYAVEVRNRFKGLELIDTVPNELSVFGVIFILLIEESYFLLLYLLSTRLNRNCFSCPFLRFSS